jgi:hypothetical protein
MAPELIPGSTSGRPKRMNWLDHEAILCPFDLGPPPFVLPYLYISLQTNQKSWSGGGHI